MKEKYFYITPQKARKLLHQVQEMQAEKQGFDKQVYLFDEYAVLKTTKLKIRNYPTRDDDLIYYDELIKSLMHLRTQGVATVPILGYCYDSQSENGDGYIIQQRAKGEELYDDAKLKNYYVGKESFSYLFNYNDVKAYFLDRTQEISQVPQEHFDQWIKDSIILLENDILVDFHTKSNFFYDAREGFSFIDLDSHTDYKYGLTDQKPNTKEIVSYYGFLPCHFAADTKVLPNLALDQTTLAEMEERELSMLASANQVIYNKCKNALLHNGILQKQIDSALTMVKIYGI